MNRIVQEERVTLVLLGPDGHLKATVTFIQTRS